MDKEVEETQKTKKDKFENKVQQMLKHTEGRRHEKKKKNEQEYIEE